VVLLYAASLAKSREKTIRAAKSAGRRFAKLLSDFALLLVLVSVALTVLPPERIKALLKGPGMLLGSVLAAFVGSITFIPGFISYPLAGILKKAGVPYTVLAAFLTTLMMVGFLTLPMESELFGKRFAVLRNAAYFVMAIVVSIFIGFVFGELP